jgi:hypothetical protein
VRFVDVQSEQYQALYEYMIRLRPEDFAAAGMIEKLAGAGSLSKAEFEARFSSSVRG